MYLSFIKSAEKKDAIITIPASTHSDKLSSIHTIGKVSKLTLGSSGNWAEKGNISFAFVKI